MADLNDHNEIDLEFLHGCLKEAGQIALAKRGQVAAIMSATIKDDHTPVTEVDKQVETLLIDKISARYPGHRILSEESGLYQSGETYTWVIDPIDGTRAYATGLPIWGVCVGVLRGEEPVMGGFYLPATGELYSGTRQQALYNGHPIPPVEQVDLENPLFFLAVPSGFHLHFETSYPRVRSLGSTAAQLAYATTGAAVGALNSDFNLWDIAGVLPMMYAAGVELYTLDGQNFQAGALLSGTKSKQAVLAARPQAVEALLGMIQAKPARAN
jgi:fructose-1,6-bisphosphatase/inositol monophosphatase family enzyme